MVAVGAEPFLLKGKLALPTGKGPFPGAVLVHGSGPNDMDESIGANRPFQDLAEGLASLGVAVLRYDKRTFQYGRKGNEVPSIDDEVVFDAVAAVNSIKARSEIDPQRVFVVGHSLGALLAPEIAVRGTPVAGVVLLAPPGRPPWRSLLEQLTYIGTPPDRIAEIKKSVDLMESGQLKEGQSWAPLFPIGKIGPRGTASASPESCKSPSLILRGERDYQITEEDVATWKKGLAGVSRIDFATIPEVNHLFITGSGKPGPAEYNRPGHVAENVIERIAAFISAAPR